MYVCAVVSSQISIYASHKGTVKADNAQKAFFFSKKPTFWVTSRQVRAIFVMNHDRCLHAVSVMHMAVRALSTSCRANH